MIGPHARRTESRITVRVHSAERRRRAPGIAACGCCCTSCCIHSIGGVIGAATAGWPRTVEERRATVTYWCCLLAMFGISCVWFSDSRNGLLELALLLPGIQLAASVVAAIIASIIAGPTALLRIWSITWRGFAGAVIGLGVMWIVFKGLPW